MIGRFLFFFIVAMSVSACQGTKPQNLGYERGGLETCPASPNCVSSNQDPNDEVHFIEPFPIKNSAEESIESLAAIVKAMPRTRIEIQERYYLRAEFKSRWLGFVDDVEFFVKEGDKLVQIRSASRLGYSDLGVNRERLNEIRKSFLVSN